MITIKDNSRILSTMSKTAALQKNKCHPVQQSQNKYTFNMRIS